MSKPVRKDFIPPWSSPEGEEAGTAPPPEKPTDAESGPDTDVLRTVRRKHEAALMRIDGVEGVGEERSPSAPSIIVYCRDLATTSRVPHIIEGVAVRTIVSGPFYSQEASAR